MYLSPPGQQNTTRSGTQVETFSGAAGSIGASGNFAIGSYTAATGARFDADRYGGAGGIDRYLRVLGGPISITLASPGKYVGFWWSAGDATNIIRFYDSDNNQLAEFTTASLFALLGGSGMVTAIDGNQYPTQAYYGNPNPPAGRQTNEPFGYVNLVLQGSSASIARIELSGANFELDNIAVAAAAPVDTTWVNYGSLPITVPPGGIGATDDTLATPRGVPANGDVSTNDTTVPGSSFAAQTSPANGTVVMNADGTYTYTPNPGFAGQDSFEYQQCKPAPDSAVCVTAKVTVTVAPDAVDDAVATAMNQAVSASVGGNDAVLPGSSFSLDTAPVSGVVVFNSDGTYTYTPNNNFTGQDSFIYQVCLPAPNAAMCDTATVTITVAPQAVPVATAVAVNGTPRVGSPVGGSYSYSDVNGDLEAVSTMRWVRNTSPSVAGGTQVSDAAGYTPTASDVGSYLFFCVTPVAATGLSPGAEVCSPASAPVAPLVAAAPQAIPTLSQWGMLLLSALVALGAFAAHRRREG